MSAIKNLNKMCFDMITDDINQCVPWFLVSKYLEKEGGSFQIDDSLVARMKRTIKRDWSKIEHKYKKNINVNDIDNVDIPKGISSTVQVLKKASSY